ncbi:hypothetical protein ACI796_03685 [Geodermatophilus sp. SYSU D00525]
MLDAPPTPNGADRVLLSAAIRLYADGIDHFFIASHDKAFAMLPERYTVLLADGGTPTRVLVQCAAGLRRVD